MVPGDQWSVFLYVGFQYDPNDAWKGLLRSSILVSVRFFPMHQYCLTHSFFLIWGLQVYIHVPQLSGQKWQGNTFWQRMNSQHDESYMRVHCLCCDSGKNVICIPLWWPSTWYSIGTICTQLILNLLQNGYGHWFWTLLQQCFGTFRWHQQAGRSWVPSCMVKLVIHNLD